jgi:hypothetical protein
MLAPLSLFIATPHELGARRGRDFRRRKVRAGLREGATENAAACKALLADLIERGLLTERTLLFVIDGAKVAQSTQRHLR